METLELNFGSKGVILEKIIIGLKKLPCMSSSSTGIVNFATKLRTAVIAIKSLEGVGYLLSPDLLKELLNKLPSATVDDYVKYAAQLPKPTSNIKVLADFLFLQAQMYAAIGFVDIAPLSLSENHQSGFKVKPARSNGSAAAYATCAKVTEDQEELQIVHVTTVKDCSRCNRQGHALAERPDFSRDSPSRKLYLVNKAHHCYVCLESGHRRDECDAKGCRKCGGRHHALLHEAVKNFRNQNQSKKKTNLNTSIPNGKLENDRQVQAVDERSNS